MSHRSLVILIIIPVHFMLMSQWLMQWEIMLPGTYSSQTFNSECSLQDSYLIESYLQLFWMRGSLMKVLTYQNTVIVLMFLYLSFYILWVSPIAQLVKNPPAMQQSLVLFLGQEDLLEKGQATHSSILAWRIPQTAQSSESQRIRHD